MHADTSRQPSFSMPWQEHHSRLTTFFRLILAIPSLLLVALWGLALVATVPISWFVLLFTGRYPEGLYNFHASFTRFVTRAYAYVLLATDEWPGFSGDENVDYPVSIGVGPALPVYSRLKVGLRLVLLIPVYLIFYAMQIVTEIAALIAWFAIVITGKLPQGIHQMLRLGLSYQMRAYPYFLLMTEDWPAFTVDDSRPAQEQVGGGLPQSSPASPTAAQSEPVANIAPAPPTSGAPPNLGDFRPPTPPDDAA